MEPFGFAHLRRQYGQMDPLSWPLTDREIKRLERCCVSNEEHSRTKAKSIAFSNLCYPINTPSCQYQKQLVMESLFYNLLIALPKEFDSFFVASVVMINFRRWFPQKKVVYIGITLEMIRNMVAVFMDITGCDKSDICIYGDQKKSDRFAEWSSSGIVFATAEIMLSDVKEGIDGKEISLLIVDEAQRAMTGSNPVCELVRSLILSKGKFRILALTDHRIMKVPSLQLIVTNLQIGLIRSQCSFKNVILYTICSPLMRDIYVSITHEMGSVADALIEAITGLVSILSEGDVLPSGSLQQLANYSLRSLRKGVELRMPHLLDIFKDVENLFIMYDSLMCDGITAFACAAQSIITQSATIEHIIESNIHLKEAFLRRDLLKTNELCSHKSTSLLNVVENALNKYRSDLMRDQRLVVVVLCRNRGPSYNAAIVATLKKYFAQMHVKINVIIYERGTRAAQNVSEHSLLTGVCTIIVCPCESQPMELNVGYVDLLVCMDEGVSSLYYTSKINVRDDAESYVLRTNAYETNIRPLTSEASSKECIDERTMKGVQLCTDNPQLFHRIQIPRIVEFWSTQSDQNSGMLSTLDRLAFEERLNADGGKDVYKNVIHNAHDLLRKSMDDALLWQSRPQQCHEIGHSKATLTFAKLIGASSEEINSITERLNNQSVINTEPCVEDEYLKTAQLKTLSDIKGVSNLKAILEDTTKQNPHRTINTQTNKMKRKRSEAPPVLRIDSASFGLFKKPTKLSAASFVDRLNETSNYSKRHKQLLGVVDMLRNLIRM